MIVRMKDWPLTILKQVQVIGFIDENIVLVERFTFSGSFLCKSRLRIDSHLIQILSTVRV